VNQPALAEAIRIHVLTPSPDLCYFVASVNQPVADPGKASAYIYRQAAEALGREEWQVVHERVFGSLAASESILAGRRETLQKQGLNPIRPLTFVQGSPLWGDGLAGVQIRAVRLKDRRDSWDICEDNTCWGRAWRHQGATYILLQNLHGLSGATENTHVKISPYEQTLRMFDRANRLLRSQGASYPDVIRTWIYLSRILEWYNEFNHARNAKYQEYGLMPRSMETAPTPQFGLPASTGIQGESPFNAAVVTDLFAITGEPSARPRLERMSNTRQKDAFRYGAAFCRGTTIRDPELVQFQISGTAAIDEHGVSLHPNNPSAQIRRTLDNLESLMAPVGASFEKVCSATVFLKRAEDASVYQQIAAERGLANLPAVSMIADICRPELLFELDAEAAWEVQ
jgi:enamine deaminase RidA (YjgF/YER057c/UK114 family)